MPSLDINMLRQVSGVGASTIRNLVAAGYASLDDLKPASVEQLSAISGIGAGTAQAIRDFLDRLGEGGDRVRVYRYDEKRKNIPSAELAAQGRVQEQPKSRYSYDPHLPPTLRFAADGSPDRLPDLLETAKQRKLTDDEARLLADRLRNQQPWLEWSGKREKSWFDVDPVALHIHERISAEAIVRLAQRQPLQRSLFADPELPYQQEVDFYKHDVDWANRLILGDSLTVMTSLARREDLAGKVQMIYIDPPYGIKFASNFQPFVNNREVKDRDQDLTRQPEQVKAYRDTWTLGIHSYLAYLRDRLMAAKELLKPEGSIFVQISDENVHRVRMLLDEVFGNENFIALIPFVTTSSQTSSLLPSTSDFLIWYARNRTSIKYRQIYLEKVAGETGGSKYTSTELATGERLPLGLAEDQYERARLEKSRIFRPSPLVSQSGGESSRFPVQVYGQAYVPRTGFWKTNKEGFKRLIDSNRIVIEGRSLAYVRFLDDFAVYPLNNLWEDTWGVQSRSDPKVYVVQTATKIIERCMLMTTDPGDLVLDPTCGSGTTAYVAEQWGRRWITIDTSRVAVALARQRLLTSKFDYYEKEDPSRPLHPETNKFLYESVPHIMLSTIAQCAALDPIFARWEPVLAEKLERLNLALSTVTPEIRTILQRKLAAKEKAEGRRSITDADTRRWILPSVGVDPRVHPQTPTGDVGVAPRVHPQTPTGDVGVDPRVHPQTPTGDVGVDPRVHPNPLWVDPRVHPQGQAQGPAPTGGWQEWEVPFDTDPDWPQALQDALTDYRQAWRQKMDEVNATIAASAPQETLVDRPRVVKNVVRVSGPFTVEGVQPAEENLDWTDSPIGGAPEPPVGADPRVRPDSHTRPDASVRPDSHTRPDASVRPQGQAQGPAPTGDGLDPTNAEAYFDQMIRLLKESGIRFLGNKQVSIDQLQAYSGSVYLHAEGEWNPQEEKTPRRLAVSFGPQYGPLTALQAEEGLREAYRRGYDDIVFAGFDIDGAAQAIIDANINPRVRCHTARISPDVLMGNLLKSSAASHIFTVTGTPRVEVETIDGDYVVRMEGMDVYDPVNNAIIPTNANDVAAWFLDCDYDGKTFCVSQAFFPKQDAWEKLARALKSFVEPEQFAAFSGARSLPFAVGKHKRIAVKVIDPRGNEVMRVIHLEGVRY
ncbi:MAG: hypothetical protein KF893_01370 [Caldilineaceae bacterium]|nr:hypothetical protein [Caldilineaceae bacterium]